MQKGGEKPTELVWVGKSNTPNAKDKPSHPPLEWKNEWKIEFTIASIDTLYTTLKKILHLNLRESKVESETTNKHHNCQAQVTSVCCLEKTR